MQTACIAGVGVYLPMLRFDRKAGVEALRWSGLGGVRLGRRSVAGWDEDALTLAVEAARAVLRDHALVPAEIVFASTSAPFYERAHSALAVDALNLPRSTRSIDLAGSRRCALSGLLRALDDGGKTTLVTAGEQRQTQPGSPAQLAYGDGGAAVLVASEGPARLIGVASMSGDFVDTYSSREHPTPYQAEERFVRDVAVSEVLAPTILAACRDAGIEPSLISQSAVVEPVSGCYKALASKIGLTAPNVATELAMAAGDLGAAHPLFALALAFSRAKAGDIVLLAASGSGCDAMLFKVTGEVPGAEQAVAALCSGRSFTDYVRFLSLTGSLELSWGVRSEFEQKTSATVLARHGRDTLGFIGGRDHLGNVQFPKSRIPVNPMAVGPERLTDIRLADEVAKIVAVTADRLNYSPDPPFNFGLVQFAAGARLQMEFVDAGVAGFAVGDPLIMRFRVKSLDRRRGFRTYFWKAAPQERPLLED